MKSRTGLRKNGRGDPSPFPISGAFVGLLLLRVQRKESNLTFPEAL